MTEEQKRQAIKEFFLAPQPFKDPKAIAIGAGLAFLGLLIGTSFRENRVSLSR